MKNNKLKIGIYGFTGCAGDQLTILHSEDELLNFFSAVSVTSFLMAQRNNKEENLDIALIEGSITTQEQREKLEEIASRTQTIVAIGICACYGGIQSMKLGLGSWQKRFKNIYKQNQVLLTSAFESQPIDSFIKVDFYIPGCPIDKHQFLKAFS